MSIVFSTMLLLASCTVSENIVLTDTTSSSSTDIEVYPFFIDVLNDFSDFLPSTDEPIMDKAIRDFTNSLESSGSATDASFEKTGENSYHVAFDADELGELLEKLGGTDSQTLLSQGDDYLSFHLDIDNYAELKKAIPFLSDPNFEVYGPEYNIGMSETDYLDMIYFLLGEEGPGAITDSLITIDITVPGNIAECSGVEKIGKDTVRYSFPLIDFLLLAEPMEFFVSWD